MAHLKKDARVQDWRKPIPDPGETAQGEVADGPLNQHASSSAKKPQYKINNPRAMASMVALPSTHLLHLSNRIPPTSSISALNFRIQTLADGQALTDVHSAYDAANI
jgi:hypothetical protein